jgi:hypothetical protein
MIDWNHYELKLILEEVSKLPRTTDTSYVPPDVLELAEERLFYYERTNRHRNP